jgi:gliding motility-associated-like protein
LQYFSSKASILPSGPNAFAFFQSSQAQGMLPSNNLHMPRLYKLSLSVGTLVKAPLPRTGTSTLPARYRCILAPELGVYNRYGNQIFESHGYPTPWDGTYKGSRLPQGTYYYIINAKAGTQILSGSLTIIY